MTGDERYGYLPVGKSTALSEPCQEFGQGSLGVERKRDKGQGDKETRGRGEDSPCLPLSLSPCPLVPLSPCPFSLCSCAAITGCCLRREFRGTRPVPGSIRRGRVCTR